MSEFTKDDYMSLKWPTLALVLCLGMGAALWSYFARLEDLATTDLNRSRTAFNQAESQLEAIKKDEQLMHTYIDRYDNLATNGIIGSPDRVKFQEYFAELYSTHHLFPIDLNIQSLISEELTLSAGRRSNSRPILLQTSPVEFSLSLLHENDLGVLLQDLFAKPELILTKQCSLTVTNARQASYDKLSQHLRAECSLLWFSFLAVGDSTSNLGAAK